MSINKIALNKLVRYATKKKYQITSTTSGKHNAGSKHPLGEAIDLRTLNKTDQENEAFILQARYDGFKVLDERTRPSGQKIWGGAHIHLEYIKPKILEQMAIISAVLLFAFIFVNLKKII